MTMGASYGAGERDTLLHALARAVETAGDEVFVDVQGDTFTFRELDRRATRLAHELAKLGIEKGDTVVTITETHHDTFTLWFGILKLGAIWVPINLAYRKEFLRHQITDADTKLVICDHAYLDRVVDIAGKIPHVKRILCLGNESSFPDCTIPIDSFEKHRGHDETPIPIPVQPADLAVLLYSSGTTGPSKGCMISHNYWCMQGRQQIRAVPQEEGDITWTCLPLFHSAALNSVMGALVAARRVAVWPRFSVTTFWDDIEKAGATSALLMASIFPFVAHAPDTPAMKRCFGQLKMIFGVPISAEIRRIWKERFGVKLASSFAYGQTEVSRLCMALPDETPPIDSCGRAAEEFEVMIFDNEDNPVPPGTVGQLVCRPRYPNVMFEGYWKRPEETVKAWRNFWMHTGDLAMMDEQGWVYFKDRAKDYLRNRGENVSSLEVEKTFMDHPDIADVAVHAIGVQTGEDDIKVTLVKRDGSTLTEHDLCLWSIENLPHFAVPRYYEFRAELHKNPTGKILKYKLRDEGVTPTTWDRDLAGIQVRRRRP
jgi:crotonobetaine/carnitine-CoA ligase